MKERKKERKKEREREVAKKIRNQDIKVWVIPRFI
jgi:hypothetical protein